MKRILLILLIALLPVQFSWAAVGVYCGDEHESAHEHALHAKAPAQADAGSQDGADAEKAGPSGVGFDLDCGNHCHGHSTSLPAAAFSVALGSAATQWIDELVVQCTQLIQLRPERPQWQPLA